MNHVMGGGEGVVHSMLCQVICTCDRCDKHPCYPVSIIIILPGGGGGIIFAMGVQHPSRPLIQHWCLNNMHACLPLDSFPLFTTAVDNVCFVQLL